MTPSKTAGVSRGGGTAGNKSIYILANVEIVGGRTAASARLLNYAKALALSGDRVVLCTALSGTRLSRDALDEAYPGIFVARNLLIKKRSGRIGSWLGRNSNPVFLVKYFRAVKGLMRHCKGERAVLLYPSTVSMFEFMCLMLLKMLGRERVYYEANEVRKFGLYNAIRSGNFVRRSLQAIMSWGYYIKYLLVERSTRHYDGLIAISTNMEAYFERYNRNIIRVPILSDTSEKCYSSCPTYDRMKEKFRICFAGAINLKKEGFDLLYGVLSDLKKQKRATELHLYGLPDGRSEALLFGVLRKEFDLEENIFYHRQVDPATLLAEMKKHHLLILPRAATLQAQYGFSTKLSEYLVSGVPVLVTDVSDNSLFIKDGHNGFIIEPGSAEAMREKVEYIMDNYNELVERVVDNAFETARGNFHYANFSGVLSEFLQ